MICLPKLFSGHLSGRVCKILSAAALALVIALGVYVRLGGIAGATSWNPDEVNIRHWMKMHQGGAGFPAVYPGGFFVMSRPAKTFFEKRIRGSLWHVGFRCGLTDVEYPPRGMEFRLWGILFSLLLAALSIWLAHSLARVVTGSYLGALAGAIAFAFHPIFVEHSHYLETDIAMLFCAMLTLRLMAWYSHTPGFVALALTALASGFAFGVKYTNIALLPTLLLTLFTTHVTRTFLETKSRTETSARFSGFSVVLKKALWTRRSLWLSFLAVIVLFLLGSALATPRAGSPNRERNPTSVNASAEQSPQKVPGALNESASRFVKVTNHLRRESQGLTADSDPMTARVVLVMRAFWGSFTAPGALWTLGVVVGLLALAFQRRFLPFLPLALGYPLAYGCMIFLVAPWFRTQEILPLLPFFSLAYAALVAWAIDFPSLKNTKSRYAWWFRGIGSFAVLVATVFSLACAWRRATDLDEVFAMPDTREAVEDFLAQNLPVEGKLFLDRYMVIRVDGLTNIVADGALLSKTFESRLAENPDLQGFLINGSLTGRGMLDVHSGRLSPEFQIRDDEFRRRARLVRSWGLVNAKPWQESSLQIPTFRSPICELWVIDQAADDRLTPKGFSGQNQPAEIPLTATRPVFYQGQGVVEPRPYLELPPTASHTIWFGGPGALTNGVWLVIRNANESDLEIKTKGYGGKTKSLMKRGETAMVHLKPSFLDSAGLDLRFESTHVSLRPRSSIPASRPVRIFAAFTEADAQKVATAKVGLANRAAE